MSSPAKAALLVSALLLTSWTAARADDLPGLDGAGIRRAMAQSRARQARGAPPSLRPVDLSAQFPPDAAERSQGVAGTCHDFAAIALLEAAIHRRIGGHLALSQADLFIQDTLLNDDVGTRSAMAPGGVDGGIQHYYDPYLGSGYKGKHSVDEGDSAPFDLQMALNHGVAPQADLPYSSFYPAYEKAIVPGLERDMKRADVELAALDKAEHIGPKQTVSVDGAQVGVDAEGREALLQTRIDPAQRRRVQAFLQGLDPRSLGTLEAGRLNVRQLLAGARVSSWSAPGFDSKTVLTKTPSQCLAAGARAGELIARELQAGRPVALGIDVAGLKGWTWEKSKDVLMHSVVVDGLEPGNGESLRFLVLNSWGPKYDIPIGADELCHIAQLVDLANPGEAGVLPSR